MARKIFISYKYSDSNVAPLPTVAGLLGITTARHYVDTLQAHLDVHDHINKGENDGESLAGFKNEYIESKLREKIWDSSITIVLISPNMRAPLSREDDQWIPWEISYSLKEITRNGRTSGTNAMLAVVLPDKAGSYQYFIRENTCATCQSRTLMTDSLFEILRKNMFNKKTPNLSACNYHGLSSRPHLGDDHSYIYPVKWSDFIGNINWHLDAAARIQNDLQEYDIVKSV